MCVVDNLDIVSSMLDANDDGDTFWYTELLDRDAGGNNSKRLVRMFRHHCRENLVSQMPTIRALCDVTGARAYTRLSPRSQRRVGQHLLVLTATMAAEEAWSSAGHLYARACGQSNIHGRRLWLYDVDEGQDEDGSLLQSLRDGGWLRAVVPSKAGCHYISSPHDPRNETLNGVTLHKDNPTNLYIPEDDH